MKLVCAYKKNGEVQIKTATWEQVRKAVRLSEDSLDLIQMTLETKGEAYIPTAVGQMRVQVVQEKVD